MKSFHDGAFRDDVEDDADDDDDDGSLEKNANGKICHLMYEKTKRQIFNLAIFLYPLKVNILKFAIRHKFKRPQVDTVSAICPR